MDASRIAASGIRSAHAGVAAAAHNLANLNTPDFRPVRAVQESAPGGGSRARVERAPDPEPVDLARELVSLELASVQARASARVVSAERETLGSLFDAFA